MAQFDYVVIGGGSAGCAVAGELCQTGSRVLVLECGDAAEENPETLAASGYKEAFINNRLMFDRYSVPQKECKNIPIFVGTGRGMGGSGSINAMVYTRGSAFDYASWNTSGWGWSDVVPAFERLERKLDVNRLGQTEFTETCIRAAEAAGFHRKEDLNDGTLSGYLGYEWMNIAGPSRRSSYVALLKPHLGASNLTVETRATARRILFDAKRRATGVEYERNGEVYIAEVRQEVILAAGALESPKLLMLSGIGAASELKRFHIPLVLDQPAVGQNLMDHPNVSIFYKGKRPTDCHWAQLYGFHRANPASELAQGEADTCYVFYSARSSFREGMIRLVPGMVLPMPIYRMGWPPEIIRAGIKSLFKLGLVRRFVEEVYGIVVILGKPQSRGTVRLASRSAHDHPLVDPNYFGDPEDLRTLVEGVRLARGIADAEALARWGNFELMPGRRVDSRAGIESFIRKNAMTTYHFAGTCRMGDDLQSVVNPRLEVRGVTGLRVADASTIPVVPVSAMNAPSMLIGFRAAEFIAEDARARSGAAKSEAQVRA